MKQAYTNTIRGSSRTPLTIPTGSKKGRSKQQQVPKCAYGAACTRKGCAYRHPSPTDSPYESYHEDPRSKICKPFLAGLCSYGYKCMNRHPEQQEADAVRAKYKEKICSYGDDCQTEGCLYRHPWEVAEATSNSQYAGGLTSAMGGLQLEAATPSHHGGVPTYDQWMAINCPPPPTMDENHVYNVWHYPGSGMQRTPWEVYCLMYPQNFSGASLSATSQTWEPTVNKIHAAPQSWEPANHVNLQQNGDPKTFQEWKKKGQPYPSWFCSDLDPWYDDEGVRRSLEEVYDVLYGENAEEIFARKQHAHQIASDPTPAELAAMISTNQLGTSPVIHDQSPAKGGWASIAAKPPVPVQKQMFTGNEVCIYAGKGNSDVTRGEGSANNDQKHQTVVIPKEVWLPSTANSDCFHLFPNPIERFKAVNSHHKSYLASVTVPICFGDNYGSNQIRNEKSNKGSGKVALLDVHFQSAKTITPVLNRFLIPALKKNEEVWVVTGSGHHVAVGHQKREGGGVLFNAVKRYLEEREEDMAVEFRVGKDTSGGKNKCSGGAFLVRKSQ
eukprot:CAMPEP_0181121550 /NCGR_PEP_ID=MMETSP1071-20121207/24804_1 /TAXON_ID=35127 /ORGANISM="Thalassiosira sp., Strain NH16" /LENGTH=554 /DNA_ID=CAMNT_0023206389 /DNA_START=120 /DNA_END=1784 /DNA_ORIENTATION=-